MAPSLSRIAIRCHLRCPRAQRVGVYLGLGDVVQFGFVPKFGDRADPNDFVWERGLSVVNNGDSGAYDPRSASAYSVQTWRKDQDGNMLPHIDMPGTATAAAVKVLGTLALPEVKVLIGRSLHELPDDYPPIGRSGYSVFFARRASGGGHCSIPSQPTSAASATPPPSKHPASLRVRRDKMVWEIDQ